MKENKKVIWGVRIVLAGVLVYLFFPPECPVEIPVQKMPFVKSVYLNNEIFVDFHAHALNEDRVTPVGITLQIYKKLRLKIFYMIQTKKGTRDWSSNQILGTHFLISF